MGCMGLGGDCVVTVVCRVVVVVVWGSLAQDTSVIVTRESIEKRMVDFFIAKELSLIAFVLDI
jgi:hypothetical protein